MDINITNFRGISSWRGNISNGLNLLKGESGKGKSTILEAVKWCLYGQLRQVFPFSGKKDTEVSITLNGINIVRKKNPELIKWCEKDIVLEASAAEKQIEKYFGSKLLWQAGSYIQQGEKIVLLAGSNSEKSNLIKEIVFSGQEEKSEHLTHKFREKINILEKEIHSYLYMMEDIKNKKQEYNKDNQVKLKKIKANFYESKLYQSKDILIEKLEEIKNNIQTNQEQIIINKLLEEKNNFLTKNEEKIKKYPPQLDQKKFLWWQNYITYKQNLQELEGKEDIIIEEDLDKLLHLNGIYNINKDIIKEFDLDENNIEQELNDINEKINAYYEYEKYQEKYQNYLNYQNSIKKYQDYFDSLNKLEINILKNWKYINSTLEVDLELNSDNIIIMEQKIKHYKSGFLSCPKCNQFLTLKNDKLVERSIIIDGKTSLKLEKIVTNIKLYLKNKGECQEKIIFMKENEIDKPEDKINPNIDDIRYYKNKQIKLSQYQKVEIEDINDKLIILKNREKIKEIEKNMNKIYLPFFDDYIIDEENYFSNFIALKNNINECNKYIANHENKEILDLQKEEKLITRIEEKIANIREQEDIYLIKENLDKYEKRYQKEEQKYNQANQEIKLCQKIIKIIQYSENESFTQFINYFNILTNEILAILFDNCYIKIKAFKENDKTKSIKAQLDFNIFIDGNKYDNWHILSGGEKDRVSIAMTLAFNYLKANKILLLDECMASLDVENRAKCLKAIKKYAKDKIVINICHETVEGFYDEIIDY